MKIAFYGSSLLSSYWNGAATYYRGMVKELASHGHHVTFFEPDALERQSHRDIEPPDWAESRVYPATQEGLRSVVAEAPRFDVVVKTSGVGVFDDELIVMTMAAARPDAIRIFWDVDAPATLGEIIPVPDHALRRTLPSLDFVLTYGGGPPVIETYEGLGAPRCVPVYNALDPALHHPMPPDPHFAADFSLLANRLPDREERVEEFFLKPATLLPNRQFVIGGNGWQWKQLPPNVRHVGHVYTKDHNAFNASPLAVLNVARDKMASNGYSPATRVFEAAGAATCIVTDAWVGLELFLKEGEEVLVARDGQEVAEHVEALTPERAKAIGEAAMRRVLSEHTYARRGVQVDTLLRNYREARRAA